MSFPNDQQKKVIEHTGKPLVVIAGPGTGKTSTIVARIIKLLKEDPNRAISFITFTRTSRRDTQSKVAKEVGEKVVDEFDIEFPRVSTLHTYAKSIVHKYAALVGRGSNFTILISAQGERDLFLKELIDDLSLKIPLEKVSEALICFRSTGKWPLNFRATLNEKRSILEYSDFLLQFYNTFDMEALVPTACEILSRGSANLPQVFLQVDEYQDLNPNDQKLVALACTTTSSQVIVVGDDAQSIYGFRYANPTGIVELWKSDAWEKISFPHCHRLPSHILRAAQALISDQKYLGGNVEIPKDDGRRILTLQCTRSDYQIKKIGSIIIEFLKTKKKLNGGNLSLRDFMILCPTSKFVTNVASVLENDFPLSTKQKDKGDISEEHWRLLLVLRMLHDSDSLALRQWLEIVGIEPQEIQQIRKKAIESKESLFNYCNKLDVPKIREIFGNIEDLKSNLGNVVKFVQSLKEFSGLVVKDDLFPEVGITVEEGSKQSFSITGIIRHIYEKFGLLDSNDNISNEDKILVTTFYSAKGLEAEFVFIMWLNDFFMPAQGQNIEEQLRVLYVALTRAKQDVILTFDERFDKTTNRRLTNNSISPFLKKIRSHLQLQRIRKDDLL